MWGFFLRYKNGLNNNMKLSKNSRGLQRNNKNGHMKIMVCLGTP